VEGGQHVTLDVQGQILQGFLPVKGAHNALNAAAAVAVTKALGLPVELALARLASFKPVGGRLSTHFLRGGRLQVIDDSYNANPASVKAGIDVLSESAGVPWLVLGDMAELGDLSEAYHLEVGRYAAESGIARLFACGHSAKSAGQGFLQTRQVGEDLAYCPEQSQCIERLLAAVDAFFAAQQPREEKIYLTLLIKGSRSSAMDRVVNALIERESQL
jgi:UDP-N-acetylmuramoyl-tripeptide--D-alanyl-D-alanine ligase